MRRSVPNKQIQAFRDHMAIQLLANFAKTQEKALIEVAGAQGWALERGGRHPAFTYAGHKWISLAYSKDFDRDIPVRQLVKSQHERMDILMPALLERQKAMQLLDFIIRKLFVLPNSFLDVYQVIPEDLKGYIPWELATVGNDQPATDHLSPETIANFHKHMAPYVDDLLGRVFQQHFTGV